MHLKFSRDDYTTNLVSFLNKVCHQLQFFFFKLSNYTKVFVCRVAITHSFISPDTSVAYTYFGCVTFGNEREINFEK